MGRQPIILVSFPRKLDDNFKKIGQRWGVCPWRWPAPWILHLCNVTHVLADESFFLKNKLHFRISVNQFEW